jgi:hypothetical protein
VRFLVVLRFQVTIARNCQGLTCCMSVSYVVVYEQVRRLLFQCFVSVLSSHQILVLIVC